MIWLLLLLSVKNKDELESKKSIYKTFKAWNLVTLESIEYQLTQATDPKIKAEWQNMYDVRQLSLYSLTGDKNDIPDKGEPSRYKFLQAIGFNKKFSVPTFIIETYSSGEMVFIRNYTIQNKLNSSYIVAYDYFRNKWVKVKDTIVYKTDLDSELANPGSLNYNLKGINETDVILSKFDSSGIKSHFYFSFSLGKNNVIEKIIKTWNKREK